MARRTRKSSRPAKLIRRKPSLDFSITGLIYCTMMMFIGLAAINTQANLLFGVFGLMIGILLVSFLISGLVIKRLKVERVLPDHAVVGRPTVIYYQLTNQKRFWPSLSVTVSELDGLEAFQRQPSAYMLHCANRMTASVPAEVSPRRRGIYAFDRFQLSTSFPFGFIKRAVDRHQRDAVVVLPAIGTMRPQLMQRFRSAESSGINVRPSQGGDDEFFGVREYRAGENPRRIYWKRSARTGTIVVREMTRVSPPKLMVIVDTRRLDNTKEQEVGIERAIAMAATLIDGAMEAGLPIGLLAWSGDWDIVMPSRGKRHRLELLTHLAQIEYNDKIGVNELLDKARPITQRDMTAVMISASGVSLGLSQSARSGVVMLSAREQDYKRYFDFPAEVDFSIGAPKKVGRRG
jgi:uncharacterized protein (DUF58 family)